MPTVSRTDHQSGCNVGQTCPKCRKHSKTAIAEARQLNLSDEAIAHEAARRLGVPLIEAEIDFYGDQLGPECVAVVRIGRKKVEIQLRHGFPVSEARSA